MIIIFNNQSKDLGCFHTWLIVSEPGTFPPLARFVWAYVIRDPLKEVVSIENELWSSLVVMRKQSDPTNQAISHCMMSNCVIYVKRSGCAHLHHSKSKCTFYFIMPSYFSSQYVHFNKVFPMNPGLLLKIQN